MGWWMIMIGLDEIYKSERLDEPLVLVDDVYEGYRYIILTLGTHPCAYIVLPNGHLFYGLDYYEIMDYGVYAHGGLTYSRDYLGRNQGIVSKDDGVWVIGWDYNHLDDWSGLFSLSVNMGLGNRRYSVGEIRCDVLDVINQIVCVCGGGV